MQRVMWIVLIAWAGGAEAGGWYPHADELCSEYSANAFRGNSAGGQPNPVAGDPAIDRFISEFDAVNGPVNVTRGGGLALIALRDYCDAHPSMIIGEITAQDVLADAKARGAGPATRFQLPRLPTAFTASPGSSEQPLIRCLQDTASHITEECKGVACHPDSLAFSITWAQRAYCGYTITLGALPKPVPPEPLLKCLQEAAGRATASCKEARCPAEEILFIVGYSQQARCAYTALRPMKLPIGRTSGN
jgi:hypothetical protein